MSPKGSDDLPRLPQLDDMAPLAAWLSRHLLKVTFLVLILLALCLAWLLRSYGFQLDADGLRRTAAEVHFSRSNNPIPANSFRRPNPPLGP